MLQLVLFALVCVSWGAAGFALCWSTHTQKGIGVDPFEYLVPNDPSGLFVGLRPERSVEEKV